MDEYLIEITDKDVCKYTNEDGASSDRHTLTVNLKKYIKVDGLLRAHHISETLSEIFSEEIHPENLFAGLVHSLIYSRYEDKDCNSLENVDVPTTDEMYLCEYHIKVTRITPINFITIAGFKY